MTTYAIPDDVSFTGAWWLPTGVTRKIPGTLAWSKNKAALELHDSFIPLRSGPLLQSSQPQPVIHGTTTDSKLVSVLDASWSRGNVSFGQAGMQRPESFLSHMVAIGAHVDKETLYTEVRVRIPGLQTLLGIGWIEETLVQKTEHSPACMIYRANGVQEERIGIPPISATLGWGIDRHFSGDRLTKLSITSAAHLRIAPDQPRNLDWFFEQLFKVTTLLAFIAGAPMIADQVTVRVAASNADAHLLVGWNNPVYCPHRNAHEFFLLRGTMAVNLDAMFQTWFRTYDTVAAPSQLALSVLSSEKPWIHVEFLLLMQALEGFHRAVADGTYMSPDDYERVRHALATAIPASVGANHRDALKSRIKYGNELSLRKRLHDLAGRLDAPLRERIFGGTGTVPPKWVATRNYYTHWDEASRNDALDTQGMYNATVRLRHFLRVLYLDFVGVPQEAIAKALDGTNAESQHLLQINHPAASFGYVNVSSTDMAESKAEKSN
jgi:hypothetical protein